MKTVLLVASARAVSILANRFSSATCRFMLVLPIVARMAAGTIRLVRRRTPVNRRIVRYVASRASEIAAVVQRFIWQANVRVRVG